MTLLLGHNRGHRPLIECAKITAAIAWNRTRKLWVDERRKMSPVPNREIKNEDCRFENGKRTHPGEILRAAPTVGRRTIHFHGVRREGQSQVRCAQARTRHGAVGYESIVRR